MQRAARPFPFGIEGVIPSVVIPEAVSNDEIKHVVPIVIDIRPLIGANASVGRKRRRRIDLILRRQITSGKFRQFMPRDEHSWFAIRVTDADIPKGWADASRRLKDRQRGLV